MKKTDVNAVIEGHVKDHLSPQEDERKEISKRYGDLSEMLQGENFQSGSYARFTSTTPVNDLDVIWVIPQMIVQKRAIDPAELDPTDILQDLAQRLRLEYKKRGISVRIKAQSHSVGIYFGNDDEFSIDVVPAMDIGDTNEFGDSMYLVPEIARLSKTQRMAKYASGGDISWIPSDPRGYIECARLLNEKNESFRKAVKFVKAWKAACKRHDAQFPLKSFHLEQILTRQFSANEAWDCFDGLAGAFITLTSTTKLTQPDYQDRANPERYIDDYVEELSNSQREKIVKLAELAYQILDKARHASDEAEVQEIINEILNVNEYASKTTGESFLWSRGITTDIDPNIRLSIVGRVLPKDGFREYDLKNTSNRVQRKRKIRFRAECSLSPTEYTTKWKVKNRGEEAKDRNSLRGEITDHHTQNDPETTEYIGHHYVECYAIKDGVCVAVARQDVIIE